MPLVFAGCVTRGPGVAARLAAAPEAQTAPYFAAEIRLREAIAAAAPDALAIVAPAKAGDAGAGETPDFLMGDDALSRALAGPLREAFGIALSGAPMPDHAAATLRDFAPAGAASAAILVNCRRSPMPETGTCFDFGRALRQAAETLPRRIALLGCGGLSHDPAPPPGRIDRHWDRHFLDDFLHRRRRALAVDYDEEAIEAEGGPDGHEIRAWTVVSGAAEGAVGKLLIYHPMPAFAVAGAIATMAV